jgi:phosphate uptake regulator
VVFDFFRGSSGPQGIDAVEAQIVQMVRDSRTVFEASMAAVFGGGKSKETKAEVRQTDQGINRAQQDVRRTLMLHASVQGDVDLPLVLTYMSVVKDAERIGDYAKNLYDLAKFGVNFEVAPDRAELEGYYKNVDRLLADAADAFEQSDSERAQQLIDKADGFLDDYDDHVRAAYESQGPASDAVARTLYYRFLKRITAHVMNLLTSLVMPVDRLDYYDEAPDDRD